MRTSVYATIPILVVLFAVLTTPLVNPLLVGVTIKTSGTIVYPGDIGLKLHTEGRYIIDDLGRVVLLRGINKGGYNNIPYGRWQMEGEGAYQSKTEFREEAVHWQCEIMRDTWGINVMRWTTRIDWWLDNYNNYRYNIRRGIEIAAEYGIYVIFVPWSVVSTDGQDYMPFPPYTAHPEIITSQQDFIDYWVSVANELGDLPNVIFELYNEPIGQNGYDNEADRAVWFDVAARCINAIRKVTDTIVCVQWRYGVGRRMPVTDWVDLFISYLESQNAIHNIVVTTHTYHDNWTFMAGLPNTLEELRQEYTNYEMWSGGGIYHMAQEINVPMLIGEIGRNNGMGAQMADENTWFANSLYLFNEFEIGYCVWTWFPENGMIHGILLPQPPFQPYPNDAGQILIDAIKSGS